MLLMSSARLTGAAMDSKTTPIRTGLSDSRVTAVGLIGALILLSDIGSAQEVSELSDLIFEPVPLSSATDFQASAEGSSAADAEALLKSVDEYRRAIERLRRPGPPDPDLAEQLGLLAVAYQGLDRHEEALEALDEAISVTKQYGGRNNLDQIALQEQKLPSYRALGDIKSTDDTEDLIYSLKQKRFRAGSREMYYAAINLADWNTTAYYKENYGAGNRTLKRQRVVLPRTERCISVPGTSPGEGSSGCQQNPIFTGEIKDVFNDDINDARLRKIDRLYTNYQEALVDNGSVQLDIIVDLAKRVARLAYATKQEMDFERDNYVYDPHYDGSREQTVRNSPARMDESYLTGEKALKYAIDYPSKVAEFRPEALAASLLDLGDWHLAYGKVPAAEKAYEQAYRVLLDAGFSSESIDVALATDMPVKIPVFATHLYTRRSNGMSENAKLDFKGYLDLSYSVDGLGNAHDVEFLGRSSEDSAEIERLLVIQLKSMKFRPTLRGGELISPGRVEARYYYSY